MCRGMCVLGGGRVNSHRGRGKKQKPRQYLGPLLHFLVLKPLLTLLVHVLSLPWVVQTRPMAQDDGYGTDA